MLWRTIVQRMVLPLQQIHLSEHVRNKNPKELTMMWGTLWADGTRQEVVARDVVVDVCAPHAGGIWFLLGLFTTPISLIKVSTNVSYSCFLGSMCVQSVLLRLQERRSVLGSVVGIIISITLKGVQTSGWMDVWLNTLSALKSNFTCSIKNS